MSSQTDPYRWYHKGALIRDGSNGNFFLVVEPWDGRKALIEWYGKDGAPLLDSEALPRIATPSPQDRMVRSARVDVASGISAEDPSIALPKQERDRKKVLGYITSVFNRNPAVQELDQSAKAPRPLARMRAAVQKFSKVAVAASIVYGAIGFYDNTPDGPGDSRTRGTTSASTSSSVAANMAISDKVIKSLVSSGESLSMVARSLFSEPDSGRSQPTMPSRDVEIAGRYGDWQSLGVAATLKDDVEPKSVAANTVDSKPTPAKPFVPPRKPGRDAR